LKSRSWTPFSIKYLPAGVVLLDDRADIIALVKEENTPIRAELAEIKELLEHNGVEQS